jgi:hypothetical protein
MGQTALSSINFPEGCCGNPLGKRVHSKNIKATEKFSVAFEQIYFYSA